VSELIRILGYVAAAPRTAQRLKQLKQKDAGSDIELKRKRAIGRDANVPKRTIAAGVIGAG
jgi:hypothetical protein